MYDLLLPLGIKMLTHFKPMFHLWKNQMVGFYKQNVWKKPVEQWHFKFRFTSMNCIFTLNVTLPQLLFIHVASKYQLPGSLIIGTLAWNWFRTKNFWVVMKIQSVSVHLFVTFCCTGRFTETWVFTNIERCSFFILCFY